MIGKAKRAQYTFEFKLEAVRLVKDGHKHGGSGGPRRFDFDRAPNPLADHRGIDEVDSRYSVNSSSSNHPNLSSGRRQPYQRLRRITSQH